MRIVFIIWFLLFSFLVFSQERDDYLVLKWRFVSDSVYQDLDQCAYYDTCGNEVIPFDKYPMCYTDTFRTIAFVQKEYDGIVAINRNEKILFNVFPFDNGPDYPSEGLYRIIKDGKIGYADLKGNIIIKPQFTCAHPFENGKAEVSCNCSITRVGEYVSWGGGNWFYINRLGERLER